MGIITAYLHSEVYSYYTHNYLFIIAPSRLSTPCVNSIGHYVYFFGLILYYAPNFLFVEHCDHKTRYCNVSVSSPLEVVQRNLNSRYRYRSSSFGFPKLQELCINCIDPDLPQLHRSVRLDFRSTTIHCIDLCLTTTVRFFWTPWVVQFMISIRNLPNFPRHQELCNL